MLNHFVHKLGRHWSMKQLLNKSLGLPSLLQIEPTNECNLNCEMCARKNFNENELIGNMPLTSFCKLINELKDSLRAINLSGYGENLLNKNLVEMIKYAKSKKIEVTSVTNGLLLNKEYSDKLVLSGLDRLIISIESIEPKKFGKIRGVDLNRVLNGLNNVIESKKKFNSNIFLRINTILMNETIDEMESLISFASEMKVNELHFNKFKTLDDVEKNEFKSKTIAIRGKQPVINQLRKGIVFAKQKKVKTNLLGLIKQMENNWNYFENEFNLDFVPCYQIYFSSFVSWYGALRPCCLFYDSKFDLGNVFEEGFERVWNGEKYQQFRKNLNQLFNLPQTCLSCSSYNINSNICKKLGRCE
jgi:radical SAM protein with 4Fe4S-binding SPASM domain